MESNVSIQENFLAEEEFIVLRDIITAVDFPWFFTPTTVSETIDIKDKESTTGLFFHLVYHLEGNSYGIPASDLFLQRFRPIMDQLNVSILTRIKLNLQPRLPKPDFATFHTDTDNFEKNVQKAWTTSILYINTNNGYTEIEDSTIVESVANRLVSFPSNLKHRGISQTDEQRRILINFNYLKRQDNQ